MDWQWPAAARARAHGGRLRDAGRLRPAAPVPPRSGRRRPWPARECGAFLLFDFYNIRYTTQTWIGGALGDKMTRYALLTRDSPGRRCGTSARPPGTTSCTRPGCRTRTAAPGMLGLRGAIAPSAGLMESAVREIKGMLEDAGVADLPVGVDIVEPPFLFEMQRQGLTVVDAQQLMLDARHDQVERRDHAAEPGRGHGRRRLPGHRRGAQARHPGERDRGAGQQAALRDGLGPGRGGQRGVRRAVQPAPAQLHRPPHPARRPGVLRHHPLVQRVPDLLLPDLRRG